MKYPVIARLHSRLNDQKMEAKHTSGKLTKPRPKRRRFTKLEFPFPVPQQKSKAEHVWYYYEGFLRSNCVVVENVGDLTFLYKMGYFGKGILSRSKPEYEKISNISQLAFSSSDKLRRLPPRERRIRQSKFQKCRKERFRQHSLWSKMHPLSKELTPDQSVSAEQRITLQEPSPDESDVDIAVECVDDDEDRMDDDDDDDVRIEDVIQDLVNKESSMIKDSECSEKKKKLDPYRIYEFLQLTLEEAFFLSFGLGCLSIIKAEQKLSLSVLWSEFCQKSPDFLRNYIAYHYYRSKGWVPQVGLKYGTDLVLYKKGMPFYHSSYAVVTTLVDEEGKRLKQQGNISSGREWTWKSLAALNRLNEHVAKEVLICCITVPSETTSSDLDSPQCLRNCKVQEMVVRRWIPKRARECSS